MKQRFTYILLIVLFASFFAGCVKETEEETPQVAERGKVIGFFKNFTYTPEELTGLMYLVDPNLVAQVNVEYTIEMYSVLYETIDADGNAIQASGLLVVPQSTGFLPIVSFQHGTILNRIDVPSTSGSGKEVGMIMGTEGYVAVLPDFLGLGQGHGFHPYMHAETEATAVIDMIRAAKTICKDLNKNLNGQLFMMGYSQGGHVAMAAHKMIQEQYSDEFTVTAAAPMAGPYDVSGAMYDILMKEEAYVTPSFFPYVLYSYNPIYKIFDDLDEIFISPYNTQLKEYFREGTTYDLSAVDEILPSSKIPTDIIKPEIVTEIKNNPNHPLRLALADNDLYNWTPTAPIQMYHCDQDVHVPPANSEKAYNQFITNGATNVTVINPFAGGTHITCVLPSILSAKTWFNTLKE